MSSPAYGVIFITSEEGNIGSELYNYNDQILVNEFDNQDISLVWRGQKKGRQDYVVVRGDREIHVCARRKKGESYKYYGILDNTTMRQVFNGNHLEGVPDSYFFKVREGRVPYRTELSGELSPQAQAVQSLGFRYNGGCCGIYKVWNA